MAVGTADAPTERTLTYTSNGRPQTLKDAENNLTTYEYDGHDRLSKTRFPVTTQGANSSSTTDYEQLTYDAASNVTNRRLRDAQNIAFTYDNLNRPTLKNLPGSEPDVTYAYDNLGRLTAASQTGHSLTFTYDALSRNLTQAGPQGTVASEWDLAGRRTKLTYPGSGLYVDYDYLVTGDMTKIRENGATSGIGVLATFAYDNLGRRTSLTYGNGTSTTYAFDPVSRLTSITNDLAGTTNDLTIGSMSYSPGSQIMGQLRSNDAYAWTGYGSGSTTSLANGLNQLTSSATSHDSKGNLTTDPTTGKTYGYSSENLLVSASGGVLLGYDPAMRLYQLAAGSTTRLAYDGLDMIAEYDGSNALQRRFVHGPGMDEPLVQYEGSGTTDRRFMHADERGSIVSLTDGSGNLLGANAYDEYGKPQSTNAGRFQYTGQLWLSEIGLQYSKTRMYGPHLGRFWQTDPIGYEDSPNLYAYVLNDPANLVDPLGLQSGLDIVVTAGALKRKEVYVTGGNEGGAGSGGVRQEGDGTIVVRGEKKKESKTAPKKEDFHYRVQDFAFCSADELFAEFRKAGNSAPDAPYAEAGTRTGVRLAGDNYITQNVDVASRTITNVTELRHVFYHGSVVIRVTPTWHGSAVTIEGRGTNPNFLNYLENRIGGLATFTALGARATISCTVKAL